MKRVLLGLFAATLSTCAASQPGAPDGGAPPPADAAADIPDADVIDASSPDAAPVLGISWPADRQFPRFAPIAPLDVITAEGRPSDIITLLVTLEGLVNRTQPRIYVPESGRSTDMLWLEELAVAHHEVNDPLALISKYRNEIAGVVITDDSQPDTLNLATTIAGVKDGVVASPALAATLTAAPYSLPVIEDLRAHHFGSNLQVYQYELDHYASAANHRLMVGLFHGIPGYLRDYAVATRALTVWLDPRVAAEKALLQQFLALLPPNSPYLGWWTDEGVGVRLASTFGVPTYAADFSSNLTVLGGSPRGSASVPPAPAPPPLENKIYVCIFMSDGDNLQEDEHLIPLKWARPERGQAPTAWTVSPALVDVAPVILRYFQRTATVNDVLVSGPSGLGYTYPDAWPAGAFESYARVSGHYMAEAALRIATLWNNGADLREADARAYLTHVPGLLGLTIQDATSELKLIDGKVPLLRMALSYGDTPEILQSGIDHELGRYDGSAPLFLAVQGNMNMGTIHPGAFAQVQAHYARNHNLVFLRPDHFFQLLDQAKHPPGHALFTGDFDGDGKSDVGFYYGGDGNFWIGRSTGTQLAWQLAAHTPGFGNLLDGQHRLHAADFDGDGKTDLAYYQQSDDSWHIGISDGSTLSWFDAGHGVGDLLGGARRLSVGDYTGDHKADLLVYSRSDGSWRLGMSSGHAFTWRQAASTGGFGNLLDGSHLIYDGDFTGDGKQDVLFHYVGDGNWWLGTSDGANLTWSNAGSTSGFGDVVDGSHRLLVGDFDGDHKADLLFHYGGNGDWWMGLSDGSKFTWHRAGNTSLGDLLDWRHRLYVVDADGDGKADVLAYDSGTGAWWRGRSDGSALTFSKVDDSSGLGDLVDPGRALFLGDYDGDRKTDALFYYNGDGNWWLRKGAGNPLAWRVAGNSSGFGDLLH
jgi:GxGYxY sequence motif in domain of unknown function N-terminal/GxGYxYP putative glycoside hydrolase C-terminal domain/FG-GAP-like repeat